MTARAERVETVSAPKTGDRRLGEAWSSRQQRKNDALFFLASAALAVIPRAPRALARPLGRLLGTLVWALWPRGRRETAVGLQRAAISDVDALDVFRGLGTVLLDTLLLLRPTPARTSRWTFDEDSRLALNEALAEGRGVVFATGHLGAWERMASGLVEEGFPITTIARESYDPRFHRVYERLRTKRGVRVLYRGAPGFGTALVRALRAGGIVGFPMDIAGRGVRTVTVPFLGAHRDLPIGPATLAKRTGAALVVGTPTRGAEAGLAVKITRIAAKNEASTAELTAELARALEARIRALPSEWPWMLVAKDGSAPLESEGPQELSCAKRSTPPSPESTQPATSVRCR